MRAATEEIMMMYFLASALCVQNACIYTARGDRSQTLPQRIFSPHPFPARAAYIAARLVHSFAHARYSHGISARLNIFRLPFQ